MAITKTIYQDVKWIGRQNQATLCGCELIDIAELTNIALVSSRTASYVMDAITDELAFA